MDGNPQSPLAHLHCPIPFRSLCRSLFSPPPRGPPVQGGRGTRGARSLTCLGILSRRPPGVGTAGVGPEEQRAGVPAWSPRPTARAAGWLKVVDRWAGRGAEGRGAGRGWELGPSPRQEVLTRKPGAGGGEIQNAREGGCVGVGPLRPSSRADPTAWIGRREGMSRGEEQGPRARVPPRLFTSCAALGYSASPASAFLSEKWGGGGESMRSSTSGTFPLRPNNRYLIKDTTRGPTDSIPDWEKSTGKRPLRFSGRPKAP